MRFHVVALPHTHTTSEYLACAFTAKVISFCRMMMSRGHEVFLYGGEQNTAPCDEHIVCVSESDRAKHLNGNHFITASFDPTMELWRKANAAAVTEISKRALPKDFICLIGGTSQKPIADALPHLMSVEYAIGYGGSFAPYRVFESYAWMHTCYGAATNGSPNAADGGWWDDVISGGMDPAQFPFSDKKDDYYLFIGRLIERKGYTIAVEVCADIGAKLVVAGYGTPPEGCEYVGIVGPEERGRLMSRAKAVFVPTTYLEPLGFVCIEAQLCGTPVITTDWGAFTETVVPGMTGFRCRTFGEFKGAALSVDQLDPNTIRDRAVSKYGIDAIAKRYEDYFARLLHLWSDGWYEGKSKSNSGRHDGR